MTLPPFAPSVAAIWDRAWSAPWAWFAIVTFNIGLGQDYLLGGESRISSPSYAALRLVGHEAAGLIFLTAGFAVLLAAFIGLRPLQAAFWVLVGLHLLLCAGFVIAVSTEPPPPAFAPPPPLAEWPRPATSGVWFSGFITLAHLINAAVLGRRGPAGEGGADA